jgi:hypothetical protein
MAKKRTITIQMDAWADLEQMRRIMYPKTTTYTELIQRIAKDVLKR